MLPPACEGVKVRRVDEREATEAFRWPSGEEGVSCAGWREVEQACELRGGLRVRVRRVSARARREGGMSGCDAGGRESASDASSSFCEDEAEGDIVLHICVAALIER